MIQGPLEGLSPVEGQSCLGLELCWHEIQSQHGETAAIPRRFRGITKEKFWAVRKTWCFGGVVLVEL